MIDLFWLGFWRYECWWLGGAQVNALEFPLSTAHIIRNKWIQRDKRLSIACKLIVFF
jgi:hypothetical protein